MKFTHQRIAYYATCIQWDGTNADAVIAAVGGNATLSTLYGIGYIVARLPDGISTLRTGDWVRIGQDGSIKIVKDADFVKSYRAIPNHD